MNTWKVINVLLQKLALSVKKLRYCLQIMKIKNEKLQRIKELIAKKGTRKRLKNNNLRTRYIKHVKQQ